MADTEQGNTHSRQNQTTGDWERHFDPNYVTPPTPATRKTPPEKPIGIPRRSPIASRPRHSS